MKDCVEVGIERSRGMTPVQAAAVARCELLPVLPQPASIAACLQAAKLGPVQIPSFRARPDSSEENFVSAPLAIHLSCGSKGCAFSGSDLRQGPLSVTRVTIKQRAAFFW